MLMSGARSGGMEWQRSADHEERDRAASNPPWGSTDIYDCLVDIMTWCDVDVRSKIRRYGVITLSRSWRTLPSCDTTCCRSSTPSSTSVISPARPSSNLSSLCQSRSHFTCFAAGSLAYSGGGWWGLKPLPWPDLWTFFHHVIQPTLYTFSCYKRREFWHSCDWPSQLNHSNFTKICHFKSRKLKFTPPLLGMGTPPPHIHPLAPLTSWSRSLQCLNSKPPSLKISGYTSVCMFVSWSHMGCVHIFFGDPDLPAGRGFWGRQLILGHAKTLFSTVYGRCLQLCGLSLSVL